MSIKPDIRETPVLGFVYKPGLLSRLFNLEILYLPVPGTILCNDQSNGHQSIMIRDESGCQRIGNIVKFLQSIVCAAHNAGEENESDGVLNEFARIALNGLQIDDRVRLAHHPKKDILCIGQRTLAREQAFYIEQLPAIWPELESQLLSPLNTEDEKQPNHRLTSPHHIRIAFLLAKRLTQSANSTLWDNNILEMTSIILRNAGFEYVPSHLSRGKYLFFQGEHLRALTIS